MQTIRFIPSSNSLMRMVGEVLDKPPVEVDESDEGLDLLPILRNRPFQHTRNFHRVHLHCSFQHYYTKVLDAGLLCRGQELKGSRNGSFIQKK
jgi:hypothetical protein